MRAVLLALSLIAVPMTAHAYELPDPEIFVEGYYDCEAGTSDDENCQAVAQALTEARANGWCWRDDWVKCE